jgi:hypothetical protein
MVNYITLKFHAFPLLRLISLTFISSFLCQNLWAAQEAVIITERAVIYSDKEMKSPIGFVSHGKKIMVGEIARNKGQVYPTIVSGKVAYVRVLDVSTAKDDTITNQVTARRFGKVAEKTFSSKVVASYFAYHTQIRQNETNGDVLDKSALMWHGASLKGEILVKNSFDVQIITNYMQLEEGSETYRAVEFGAGLAYRLIDVKKFLARIEGQFLSVPFVTYSINDDFRVKSYGYTVGAGANITYLFDQNWGAEAYAGVYQTKFLGFKTPGTYKDFSPTFTGNRIGIGMNYTY